MTFTKEFLESDVSVAQLPGDYRLLGALQGIPIIESDDLEYNEMYFGHGTQGLIVGDARHFLYRMKMLDLDQKCREAAAAHIKSSARRILGEEWELSLR